MSSWPRSRGLDRPEAAEPPLLDRRIRRSLPGGRPAATSGSRTPGRAATPPRCTRAPRSPMPTPRRAATRGWACTASAPTSDSPELALQFLDDKLAEQTCSNAVTLFYYGCANSDVMAAIDDPVLIEAFGINDPSILESTNFTPPVTEAQRDAWTDDVDEGEGRVAHLDHYPLTSGGRSGAGPAGVPRLPGPASVRLAGPAAAGADGADRGDQPSSRAGSASTSVIPGRRRWSNTRRSWRRPRTCACWASRR